MKPVYCSKGHENPTGNHFCQQCGEPLPVSSPPAAAHPAVSLSISPGILLGERYCIVRQLGQGGFGRTYLAEDINRFNERCVLKEFAPQVRGTYALQKGKELFEREAGVLYKLQHRQIPRFREMFRANINSEGHLFLVQDFVEGETYRSLLSDRRLQNQLFREDEIIQLLLQILPVLEYIHSLGVIHRDISPDNLMLRTSDSLPVLIDFGGVKQVEVEVESEFSGAGSAPTPGTRVGKAGYAPDEQMQIGLVYPHSDLYALAVTALVLLTGKPPQELRDSHTLTWNWHQYVSLSPAFSAVLNRILAQRPGDRYPSAGAVLQALTGISSAPAPPTIAPANSTPPPPAGTTHTTQPVSPAPPTAVPAPPPPRRRSSKWVNFLLMFLIIAGMGGVGWVVGKMWPTLPYIDEPINGFNKFSPEERQRKEALRERRLSLGVNYNFYNALVDDIYYAKYPDQQGRTLSPDPIDAGWRERWDSAAAESLQKLATLSPEARQKLGSYNQDDIARHKQEINKLHLSSRALNDLTDALFFSLFPEFNRGENLLDQPVGQVWQAIAAERVEEVKSGAALEVIKFGPGATGTSVTGTLEPGAGKAYIAQLATDQLLQVKLNAGGAMRLSVYPPRANRSPLLEDSKQVSWYGRLPESGNYEFVVVSDASEPVDYQLSVEATNSKR
jgi:serine/threonine-protein kinase